ncbi:MAG: NAD(P)H-dependent oxidoreductase subunit E [Nitrospiraceae bacterium]|nr:MAG: NAD(P)H-dependent oxidoreductase subunit E [Nitrospiraceae bacterium]
MEKNCQKILHRYNAEGGSVVSLLQDIQEAFGYIREDVVDWFSDELNVPASNFFGVATFYAQFYLKPRGKNIITACCGTACHVKGSAPIIEKLRMDLKIPEGEVTSKNGKYTLESVACVGACSIAPVFIANKKVFGKLTAEMADAMIKGLEKK